MEYRKLPDGYWFKGKNDKYLVIGFQYGGHMGGECEIQLPTSKLDKFCDCSSWRNETVNRFYKIVFLAAPDLNIPIPASEAAKSGIVPDEW